MRFLSKLYKFGCEQHHRTCYTVKDMPLHHDHPLHHFSFSSSACLILAIPFVHFHYILYETTFWVLGINFLGHWCSWDWTSSQTENLVHFWFLSHPSVEPCSFMTLFCFTNDVHIWVWIKQIFGWVHALPDDMQWGHLQVQFGAFLLLEDGIQTLLSETSCAEASHVWNVGQCQ